jgi:N-acetylneuraminic acid mutarotase
MRKICLVVALVLCCALTWGLSACGAADTTTTTLSSPTTTVRETTSTAAQTTTTVAPTTTTAAPPSTSWTDLAPAGAVPVARGFHGLACDSDTGQTILFGGMDGTVPFDDTWAYNPATNAWTDLAPAGGAPTARAGAPMIYSSACKEIVLFGGYNGEGAFADTWGYSPEENSWVDLTRDDTGAPPARAFHAMVYDPAANQAVLFGGMGGPETYFNDTWLYDCKTGVWTDAKPAGAVPPARAFHGLAIDPGSGKVVLFGGYDSAQYFGDTWIYDLAANSWTEAAPSGAVPPGRTRASLVFAAASGRFVLFGGVAGTAVFDDTWTYDPVANTWTNLMSPGSGPAGRDGQAMVYDAKTDRAILFGGSAGTSFFNDTWALSN